MRRHLVTAVLTVTFIATACSGDDDAAPSTTSATTAPGAGTTATPATTASPGTTVATGRYRATIRRTTDDVAHITGDDLASVSFGQGWASAEDHACTLADQVIRVRSERAATFGAGDGDANVDSDFAWKHLGLAAQADADFTDQPADIQTQFEAFAAGWSAHLADVGVDGLTGWCQGQDWVRPVTARDVWLQARAIMLNASGARLTQYLGKAQPPGSAPGSSRSAPSPLELAAAPTASNGWALGRDRSQDADAVLIGNPHFPWEGQLRFWEVHLTVPGEMDVYGANLIGLPGVGIGFTDGVAWTHTVSAGNRFTAYSLPLVPGTPTSYVLDGAATPLTSKDVTVDVLAPDGTTTPVTRTLWWSDLGPVLDFPGVGWSSERVITYRDANLDNQEFAQQYRAMDTATSLDELIAAHATHQGIPLFNTIAVGADGRAWYADTSATPHLSDEAIAAWEASTDPIVTLAKDQGVVLLDGGSSSTRWVEEAGARDPGLVPFTRMPSLERSDYVFNANDSFWLAHADEVLEGDYSPLHGRQRTARSPRTRENATLLRDTSPTGPAGADGRFSLAEAQDAALGNTGYTARALRAAVVERCQGRTTVDVAPLANADGTEALPGGSVDVTAVCAAVAAWDGRYELSSKGAAAWRETIAPFANADLTRQGPLWAEPFDPARPVDTPAGLATGPAGQPEPIVVNLARAAQALAKAGVAPDASLGDIQQADRNGTKVPIHGGTNDDGATNIVGFGRSTATLEPLPAVPPVVAPGASIRPGGYPIDNGTSFVLSVAFRDGAPTAEVLMTYGNSGDRTSDVFVRATERFSRKEWRTARFTDAEIQADPALTTEEVAGD